MRWVAPGELPLFDFLEGDVEFVKRLAQSNQPQMDADSRR
jgi:hypothetical protein